MANCKYLECKNKISKIIGHCKHCNVIFCSHHRLPESHNCIKLIELRLNEKAALAQKLYSNSVIKTKLNNI